MKNWLKENWFKSLMIVLLFMIVLIYAFDTFKKYQPKTLDEKLEKELLKRTK